MRLITKKTKRRVVFAEHTGDPARVWDPKKVRRLEELRALRLDNDERRKLEADPQAVEGAPQDRILRVLWDGDEVEILPGQRYETELKMAQFVQEKTALRIEVKLPLKPGEKVRRSIVEKISSPVQIEIVDEDGDAVTVTPFGILVNEKTAEVRTSSIKEDLVPTEAGLMDIIDHNRRTLKQSEKTVLRKAEGKIAKGDLGALTEKEKEILERVAKAELKDIVLHYGYEEQAEEEPSEE